jgi:hypothetical protein
VIRETGALGGYYWGLDIKRSMLAAESAAVRLCRRWRLPMRPATA